jgi:ACS family hexuronate transporter-like MFS transporter
VKHYFSLHPMLIFSLAGLSYLTALLIFHLLVPRLGQPRTA